MSKVINSLKDLGSALGMRTKVATSQPRALKCRKCGATMDQIAGTNIFVCHGSIVFQSAEGKQVTRPCENTFISKI